MTSVGKDVQKSEPLYIAGGNGKRVQSGLGTTVGLLRRKLNTELPHDPAIPLRVADPKEVKTSFETDICMACPCSITHNSQTVETSHVPISR